MIELRTGLNLFGDSRLSPNSPVLKMLTSSSLTVHRSRYTFAGHASPKTGRFFDQREPLADAIIGFAIS